MPKYLYRVSLSAEGLKGTLAEGGTSRRETISKLAENMGGRLEAFYYAFGEDDAIVIADVPDNVTAAAIATTVAAAGVGSISTTVLIEPEEIDAIGKLTVDYRPPGG